MSPHPLSNGVSTLAGAGAGVGLLQLVCATGGAGLAAGAGADAGAGSGVAHASLLPHASTLEMLLKALLLSPEGGTGFAVGHERLNALWVYALAFTGGGDLAAEILLMGGVCFGGGAGADAKPVSKRSLRLELL